MRSVSRKEFMMSASISARSSEIDDLEIEGFYLPAKGLTIRIADRIETLEEEAMRNLTFKKEPDEQETHSDEHLYLRTVPAPASQDSEAEILLQRRLLAEELHAWLADTAESVEATSGMRLNIQQVVTEGMSDALGLDREDGLLVELSTDFRDWIDPLGSFTAAWGEIISTNDGSMYLNAFAEPEEVATEPIFTKVYPSTQVKQPKTLFARVAAMLKG